MRIQTPCPPVVTFGSYFQMNVPFGGYFAENNPYPFENPSFKGHTPVFRAAMQPNDGGCIKHVKACQPIKPTVPEEEQKEGQKLNALV